MDKSRNYFSIVFLSCFKIDFYGDFQLNFVLHFVFLENIKMQLNKFGQLDFKVSALGLGLVKIGRNSNVKYPSAFSLPNDLEVEQLLEQAKSFGINLLDTAPAYGHSEERLGQLLKDRQDWVICSKAGEEFDGENSHYCFSKMHIKNSVERSLKRLKTDYIDILLIHSNGDDLNIIEQYDVFETLNELKLEGKILSSGMSTKTIEGGMLTVDHADCVMVAFNVNDQSDQSVIDHAHEKGKAVLIKKGLASGHAQSVSDSVELIFNQAGVTSLIAGTINPDHLAQNVKLVNQFS